MVDHCFENPTDAARYLQGRVETSQKGRLIFRGQRQVYYRKSRVEGWRESKTPRESMDCTLMRHIMRLADGTHRGKDWVTDEPNLVFQFWTQLVMFLGELEIRSGFKALYNRGTHETNAFSKILLQMKALHSGGEKGAAFGCAQMVLQHSEVSTGLLDWTVDWKVAIRFAMQLSVLPEPSNDGRKNHPVSPDDKKDPTSATSGKLIGQRVVYIIDMDRMRSEFPHALNGACHQFEVSGMPLFVAAYADWEVLGEAWRVYRQRGLSSLGLDNEVVTDELLHRGVMEHVFFPFSHDDSIPAALYECENYQRDLLPEDDPLRAALVNFIHSRDCGDKLRQFSQHLQRQQTSNESARDKSIREKLIDRLSDETLITPSLESGPPKIFKGMGFEAKKPESPPRGTAVPE